MLDKLLAERLQLLGRKGQAELLSLRRAWEEGIASSDDGPLDFAELVTEARRRLATRAGEG